MEIYVYTPQGFETGGIELLHQLCHELNNHEDINAYIWHERSVTISETYKQYGNNGVVTDLPPKGSILIFPESWVRKANEPRYKDYQKVIYFESVYYYEANIPKDQYLKFPENTIFMSQSWYAYTWLQEKVGIDSIHVTDYLNDEYMNADLSKPRKRQIVYNPNKGLMVTKRIMAELPDEKFVPLVNMTVSEVKNLLEESMLYIDFGNHPGKDRIPREAAMCGCCVMTSREGSADNDCDVPIYSEYKFYEDFLKQAVKQIKFVLDNYEFCDGDFDSYREMIRGEKALFRYGVKQLVEKLKEVPMTNEEYKEKLLNLYIELIEKHKSDKAALKEIDIAFDEPLAEVSE